MTQRASRRGEAHRCNGRCISPGSAAGLWSVGTPGARTAREPGPDGAAVAWLFPRVVLP